ncbi:hypothetical protein JTF06_09545 [Desemzia sp. RIT804]|uniref:hypothetical protein n=1 Tax=Desemzia sp. RIT 804 TaxID=2810209 RepID=UPI00194DF920|nr:hypothetical protein [Desemzia sp. RIT 804]MBM6615129.1 hypothetical protein [Desemzia sp. RIT 804]
MGFWIMLISFILGVGLLISGLTSKSKGKAATSKSFLSKLSSSAGIILIGFSVYLAWPK